MPLVHSKSDKAFKTNVRTLMGDVGKSPHVQSQKQALAIAYATKRRGKAEGGKVTKPAEDDLVAGARALGEDNPVIQAMSASVKRRVKKQEGGRAQEGFAVSKPNLNLDVESLATWRPQIRGGLKVPLGGGELGISGHFHKPDQYAPVDAGGKLEWSRSFQDGGKISPEFRLPWAARTAMYGLRPNRSKALIGPTPGRADKRPESVEAGSYVVPSDIVSAIGQGNSMAGHAKIGKKFKFKAMGGPVSKRFSAGKMQSYGGGRFRMPGVPGLRRGEDFAAGGKSQEVPIQASDGEHIIQPHEVAAFGGGNLERGHDKLDKWVLTERKRHIKQLKKLKPPKKD